MDFKSIQFGKASGETEGAELPQLVSDGFLDSGVVEQFLSRDRFLLLGRKGAGKSLLGEKLKQIAASSGGELGVRVVHIADFPYSTFAEMFSSGIEPGARYPTSWAWILTLVLADCLEQHLGANRALNIDGNKALDKLRDVGLLPTTDLRRIVIQSTKSSFKASIPKLLDYQREKSFSGDGGDLGFVNLVEGMKSLIRGYSFSGSQLLVIDGLDDVMSRPTVQFDALAALAYECGRLNEWLHTEARQIGIVLLCRTDIFESLPGPNKNKVRQDSAVELDWFQSTYRADESNLIRLANLRASFSLKRDVNVLKEFFPSHMDHAVATTKFLLDLTRHTPRDFLQLLKHMQGVSRSSTSDQLTIRDVLDGARSYSEKYFLPEIKDELVGYVAVEDFSSFLSCVGEIRQRQFSVATLATVAERIGLPRQRLDVILRAMFACSAIGMYWFTPTETHRFEFKFRNPNAVFDPSRTVLLHKGLWKALNLI